jgi:hypothetical protein
VVLQGDDPGLVGIAEVAVVLTRLGTRLLTGLAGLLSALTGLLTGLHAELLHGLPEIGGGLLQRFGRLGRSARLLPRLTRLRLTVLARLTFTGHRGPFAGLLSRLLPLIVGELLPDLIELLSGLGHIQRPFRRQRRVSSRFLTLTGLLTRLLAGLLALLAGLLLTGCLGQLARIAKSLRRIGGLLGRFLRIALLEILLCRLHRGLGLLSGILGGLGFLGLALLLERLHRERFGHLIQLLGQLLGLLLQLLLSLLLGYSPGRRRCGHLLQPLGQLSLPFGQLTRIRRQFLVRSALALRHFLQFLSGLGPRLSGLLTGFRSRFNTARRQVLSRRLSLLRELIGRLGRFRFGTGLGLGVQRQFFRGEGNPLLIAESCGHGLLARRRLSRLWLPGLWLAFLRLAFCRLTFRWLTSFVHRDLCIRLTGLSRLSGQGSLFPSQFPCPVSESLERVGGLGLTGLRLSFGRLTGLWFARHWLTGFRLASFARSLFRGHRQFLTGLLSQSLGLSFGLPGELVQGLCGIGLSLGRCLTLVLPQRLIGGFRSILSFCAGQRGRDIRELPHFVVQLLLRSTLFLQSLVLSLGVLGILSQGRFGLLL